MIFVVGGHAQGKYEYVCEVYAEGYKIFNDYELAVKEQLAEGKDPLMCAAELVREERAGTEEYVIISDELGCGLVPIDSFEREYRDANGRVNCYFAKEARQVVRVVAGVACSIKG